MSEVNAVKIEIAQAIARRFNGDRRPATETFGVASVALSECLADMIFAAAKSEDHGKDLLRTCLDVMQSRWSHLAKKPCTLGQRLPK